MITKKKNKKVVATLAMRYAIDHPACLVVIRCTYGKSGGGTSTLCIHQVIGGEPDLMSGYVVQWQSWQAVSSQNDKEKIEKRTGVKIDNEKFTNPKYTFGAAFYPAICMN